VTEAHATAAAGTTGRPVRDPDPARNAAYWARIDRLVDAAPPLSDHQRAVIRIAFSEPTRHEAAA